MQRVTLVRYTTQPERADENETLSRAVFRELRSTAPNGVLYALFRDGNDFVHLFVNLNGEDSDAVTELPSFKAFAKDSGARHQAAPEVLRLGARLVDSYGGLAGDLVPA